MIYKEKCNLKVSDLHTFDNSSDPRSSSIFPWKNGNGKNWDKLMQKLHKFHKLYGKVNLAQAELKSERNFQTMEIS